MRKKKTPAITNLEEVEPAFTMPEEVEAELWRHELDGSYTNEITKIVMSAEEFEKYQWSDAGIGKMQIITEAI